MLYICSDLILLEFKHFFQYIILIYIKINKLELMEKLTIYTRMENTRLNASQQQFDITVSEYFNPAKETR